MIVDDYFDYAYSYVAYMVIFISSRRRTNLEYTTSLFDDESLIPFMLLSSCLQRCIKFIWGSYVAGFP